MSGGQRIDDHGSWVGKGGNRSVFPDGPHKVKAESSAEGEGMLMKYEDTTEAIRSTQMAGKGKMSAHKLKPGYRN